MRKLVMLALALGLVFVLAACGGDDNADDDAAQENSEEAAGSPEDFEVTEDEKLKDDEVVAKINDQEIKGEQYNALYPQIKMQISSMGEDVGQGEMKDQTVEALVSQELLRQAAEEKGIEASDDEVDEQIDEFKSQDEEQYEAFLDQYQLTEDTLKDQLKFELTLDQYAEEEFDDLEATDSEVKEMYAQLEAQGGEGQEIPELEDVEDQIKAQITQQKKAEKTQEKVDELKEEADVKTMI